jgi:hypothetical protein
MSRLLPIALCAVFLQEGCLSVGDSFSWVGSGLWIGSDASNNDCQRCPPKRCYTGRHYWSSIDDLMLRKTTRCCARRAMRQIEGESSIRLTSDFRYGFQQAYVDSAMGGNGVVPPVPPEKYWAAYYRAPVGRSRARDWYRGYQHGLQYAYYDGIATSNTVINANVVGGCGDAASYGY